MRFLCISDIHGHADALEAVLAEANERGFDQLLVCGDLCFPGPRPLDVWKLLVSHKAVCVQGLTDRAVALLDPNTLNPSDERQRDRLERLRSVHAELGEIIVTRLRLLPPIAQLPLESGHTLIMVHGCPSDPSESLSPDMSDEELLAALGDHPFDLVICGGSHQPFDRSVEDVRIVNVGSVGEAPGGGYADATIIHTTATGIHVEQFVVPLNADSD
ncbi:MAG: metallophosphoesterase family protein [Polyangiaceae bacterium]|nr:metallophosphoesterase family protein [Polyangiaceae bacterium]